jgi:EAL domain-containing protein (putative c-di-GMP-specific phosphodiesterase class I)
LLRLQLPDGGLAPPGAFIPIAERSGLMGEIDRWVVERSIEIAGRHRAAGREVLLEVNLSGRSMSDPELPAFIAERLAASGAAASQLIFEVTETAAIDNLAGASSLAIELSELGCGFALDDFGAGFSSFVYLKHLPVNDIKIDGDFIRSLAESPTDQVIVQAIVAMARGMGKRTIAECVEDAATAEMLSAIGVDYVQGYHLGHPGPIEEILPPAARTSTRRRG